MKKTNFMLFVFSFLLCQLAGVIGAFFNNQTMQTWYPTLNKPFFNPPNYVFAPVWIIIFTLMAFALYLVLRHGQNHKFYKEAVVLFLLQWLLNILWSFFFFSLMQPFMALVEILVLWLTIYLTMHYFHKIDKLAGWLLFPYIIWVSFATILNLAIVLLN